MAGKTDVEQGDQEQGKLLTAVLITGAESGCAKTASSLATETDSRAKRDALITLPEEEGGIYIIYRVGV